MQHFGGRLAELIGPPHQVRDHHGPQFNLAHDLVGKADDSIAALGVKGGRFSLSGAGSAQGCHSVLVFEARSNDYSVLTEMN